MDLTSRLQSALGAQYRVEKELGGGGMSRVFVAEEIDLGRKVVVKVLPPEMAAGVNADRFRREIQLAAKLQHPHIVPLLHAGRADDLVWYTMPLVEGESLRAKLAREGELPIPEAVRILRDVADALEYAHNHGVVHRDIKPDNVLISGHHAVVTDFGVAKAVSESTGEGRSSLTSLGVALGTPAYMAPEQAAADPHVDHRADLYALGALAYEMLTGRPPFTGTNPQQVLAAQVTQAPDVITQHRATVPAGLAALVMRCLEKKPADRWQTASEIHHQLDAMATPSGGMAPTEAVPAVRRPLNWKLVAGIAVVVVIAGFFGLRALKGGGSRALDANVVAVLPFRVAGADPSLHYLREGMIDLLAAKLTGEGGPRAADPRTVTSAWRRAAGGDEKDVDQDGALAVAKTIGAGQAILGGIVGSANHLTLSVTLLGVPGGATRAQATVEGPSDSLSQMVDEIVTQMLVRGTSLGGQVATTLTTRSLPALQSYLAGQAFYRRGDYQAAANSFHRALQVDSNFTLAAFGLVVTSGWMANAVPDADRATRLAWAGRDRLSERDRTVLEAYLGPHYPEPPLEADLLAARERAVAVAPDQADAWYFLGDKYYHNGVYLGHPDAYAHAKAAFQRAIALDSNFAGPLSHLINIAAEEGDTAAARRFGPLYLGGAAGVERGGFDLLVRWDLATATGDAALLHDFWASFDSMPNRPIYMPAYVQVRGAPASIADSMQAIVNRRAATQNDRLQAFFLRHIVTLNDGRRRAAMAALDSAERLALDPTHPIASFRLLAGLYADVDTAWAARAVPVLTAQAEAAPGATFDERFPQYRATCVLEQWRLAHGQTDHTARAVARLRAVSAPRDSVGTVQFATVCAALLDAMAAVVQRRPDAHRLIDQMDSLMLRGPNIGTTFPYHNLAVARLYDAVGDPVRALAAVRRGGPNAQRILATSWRLEGKLAAQTGDRQGAIAAYQKYIALRANPDPELKRDVDEVKAELARLLSEHN